MKNLFSAKRLQEHCGALLRLFFCAHIFFVNLIGMLDEKSLTHALTEHGGSSAWATLYTMTAMAAVGFFDTFINDVLPDDYTLKHGLEFRHLIFMGLALCFAAQMWWGVAIQSYMLIPYYLLHITFISVAAFLDIHDRYSPDSLCRVRRGIQPEGAAHANA
jgi:hypothetical protein